MTLKEIADHFSLRYYQVEAIEFTVADWAAGIFNALVSMPTATGKTRFFVALICLIFRLGKTKVLVLAPRTHLVDQPLEVFKEFFKPLYKKAKLGVYQGERKEAGDITFCTVQTMLYNGYETLRDFMLSGQRITHLIVDETHHIVAPSFFGMVQRLRSVEAWVEAYEELLELRDWLENEAPKELAKAQDAIAQAKHEGEYGEAQARLKKVQRAIKRAENRSRNWAWMDTFDFETLRPYTNSDMLMLGVTATPCREKKDENLAMAFLEIAERDEFTYIYTITQAVKDKFLCEYKAMELKAMGIDVSGINLDAAQGDKKWDKLYDAGNWPILLTDFWLWHSNQDILMRHEDGTIDHQEVLDALHAGRLKIRQFMAFMPTIYTSRGMAKTIGKEYGLIVGHADGVESLIWSPEKDDLIKIKRKDMEDMYRAGEVVGCSNFNIWTEGMDLPQMEYLWMIRATNSQTAFVQMFGRVLRLDEMNPDKIAYILSPSFRGKRIIDVRSIGQPILSKKAIDIIEQLGQMTVATNVKYRCPAIDEDGKRCCKGIVEPIIVEGQKQVEYLCPECHKVWGIQDVSPDYADLVDEKKPSGKGVMAKYVSLFQETEIAWVRRHGIWNVNIGTGGSKKNRTLADRSLYIIPPGLVRFEKVDPESYVLIVISQPVTSSVLVTHRADGTPYYKPFQKYTLGPRSGSLITWNKDFGEVLDVAQKIIDDYRGPEILTDKNAKWRKSEPSIKIMNQLTERFMVPEWELYGDNGKPIINMGEASQLYALYNGLEYMWNPKKGVLQKEDIIK